MNLLKIKLKLLIPCQNNSGKIAGGKLGKTQLILGKIKSQPAQQNWGVFESLLLLPSSASVYSQYYYHSILSYLTICICFYMSLQGTISGSGLNSMNMEFSSEKAPFVKLFRVPVFIPVPSLTYLVKGGRGKYWGVCFVLGLTAIFLFDLFLENKLQRAKKMP